MRKEFIELFTKWELDPDDCREGYSHDVMVALDGEAVVNIDEAEYCLRNDITLNEFLEYEEYVICYPESANIEEYFKSKKHEISR